MRNGVGRACLVVAALVVAAVLATDSLPALAAPGAGTVTAAPEAAAPSSTYVSLGDSYSSGEGVEPFFEAGACHRSTRAYPTQVLVPGTDTTWYSRRATEGYGWGFLACSGATTEDVLASQVTAPSREGNDHVQELDGSTRLVTITAGGDDLRFRDVLVFCALGHTSCADDAFGGQTSLSLWLRTRLETLRPQLRATYAAVHAKAPAARVVVLGYPQLFPASSAEQNCLYLRQRAVRVRGRPYSILFSHAEQDFLRQADAQLNETIEAAATDSGVAEFVPVAQAFAGHEVCGSGGAWINHEALERTRRRPFFAAAARSFHPTAVGQSVYASVLNAHLARVEGGAAAEMAAGPLRS